MSRRWSWGVPRPTGGLPLCQGMCVLSQASLLNTGGGRFSEEKWELERSRMDFFFYQRLFCLSDGPHRRLDILIKCWIVQLTHQRRDALGALCCLQCLHNLALQKFLCSGWPGTTQVLWEILLRGRFMHNFEQLELDFQLNARCCIEKVNKVSFRQLLGDATCNTNQSYSKQPEEAQLLTQTPYLCLNSMCQIGLDPKRSICISIWHFGIWSML